MNEKAVAALAWLVMILGFLAWLSALISDANHERTAWAIIDFAFFPIGIIRGILMFIGVI